ncbi:hypothetical protein J2R96_006293 [Bradyrhizobium elkanii]|nr:hypothetical protein [Bradyrhizobium elkanii]
MRLATLAEKQVRDFLVGKTANQQRNEVKAVRGFIRFAISEDSCGLSHDPTIGRAPICWGGFGAIKGNRNKPANCLRKRQH